MAGDDSDRPPRSLTSSWIRVTKKPEFDRSAPAVPKPAKHGSQGDKRRDGRSTRLFETFIISYFVSFGRTFSQAWLTESAISRKSGEIASEIFGDVFSCSFVLFLASKRK
jgi:hypothetical protein